MPDTLSLDRFLTYRLHRIARISDRGSAAAYAAECGLSLSDARCLAAIGSFGPLSVRDLARLANQDKAQASRAVTALVARGLVRKDASTVDGRGVVLTVSATGRAAHRKVVKVIAARNADIFGVLDRRERETLGALLDRVVDALGEDDRSTG